MIKSGTLIRIFIWFSQTHSVPINVSCDVHRGRQYYKQSDATHQKRIILHLQRHKQEPERTKKHSRQNQGVFFNLEQRKWIETNHTHYSNGRNQVGNIETDLFWYGDQQDIKKANCKSHHGILERMDVLFPQYFHQEKHQKGQSYGHQCIFGWPCRFLIILHRGK